jgi:hypothetical protein
MCESTSRTATARWGSLGPSELIHLARRGALKGIRGINSLLLELLCTQAAASTASFPLPPEVRRRFASAPADVRGQVAACGLLLADMGFEDGNRWREALRATDAQSQGTPEGWAPKDESIALMQATLIVCWQVVNLSQTLAVILLGMAPETVAVFTEMGLEELAHIARHHFDWIKPRWQQNPEAWSTLLEQSASGSDTTRRATLRWLQLSGGHSPWLSSWVDLQP